MQHTDTPQQKHQIYHQHLKHVKDAVFTRREADIISSILHNKGEKKIAKLLNMSSRTVGAHIYNIMQKLRCNNRDAIIDFVQQSGVIGAYNLYYTHLLIDDNFRKHLAIFTKKINTSPIKIAVKLDANATKRFTPQYRLINELEAARIYIFTDEDADQNLSVILNNLKEDNYFEQAFIFLHKIFPNDSVMAIYKSFLKTSKIIYQGSGPQQYQITNNNIISLNNSKSLTPILSSIGIAVALGLCFLLFASYQNKNQHNDIVQVISQLNHISTQVSAGNLHSEFYKRNSSLIAHIEELIDKFDDKTLEGYLRSSMFPAQDLVAAIYALNSLAIFHQANLNNSAKARALLFKAKKFAESYLRSRSKVYIDFKALSPAAHYAELSAIQNLPNVYAKTLYLLGQNCFYDGDVTSGRRYFDIARYVGIRATDFVGFLGKQQGLAKILEAEMNAAYKVGDIARAILMINNLIDLHETLLRDTRIYKNNYNPINGHYNPIKPNEQASTRIILLGKIAKYNAQLMVFKPKNNYKYYLKIIAAYNEPNGIFELFNSAEVEDSRKATMLNLLADTLLACKKDGFDYSLLASYAQEKFQLNSPIKQTISAIYYKAIKLSKDDGTKHHALNGLIKLENATGHLTNKIILRRLQKELKEIIASKKSGLKGVKERFDILPLNL